MASCGSNVISHMAFMAQRDWLRTTWQQNYEPMMADFRFYSAISFKSLESCENGDNVRMLITFSQYRNVRVMRLMCANK